MQWYTCPVGTTVRGLLENAGGSYLLKRGLQTLHQPHSGLIRLVEEVDTSASFSQCPGDFPLQTDLLLAMVQETLRPSVFVRLQCGDRMASSVYHSHSAVDTVGDTGAHWVPLYEIGGCQPTGVVHGAVCVECHENGIHPLTVTL